MMEDNDWLKGLQSKMKDYEEPAPEGLWENIESSAFPEKKRRVIALPILWRSVGVAAAVALGVFAGLRFFDSPVGNPSDRSQERIPDRNRPLKKFERRQLSVCGRRSRPRAFRSNCS